MVAVGQWTGREASALRSAYRMPITGFAARLGIAEGTVSKWDKKGAGVTPTPDMQAILDTTLEQAPDEVQDRFALLCAQQRVPGLPDWQGDDVASEMNRREILRLMAVTGPALAFGGAVDAERVTDPRADTSPALLAEYQKVNARLWHVYAQASPKRAVLPMVNEHLAVLTGRLRAAGGTARAQLCAMASEIWQLSGEIFFDGNRYTDAAHCYNLAADTAREAGSADLWACALTRHSFVYVYGREFPDAVPMLEAAAGVALRGDRSRPAWQWAECVHAQALAGLGDLHGCEEALEAAGTVAGLNIKPGGEGWLRFDDSRTHEERGSCYAALNRPDLAAKSLQDALTGSLSGRRRGSVHVDLAVTGLQRGELDLFAEHAGTALQLAEDTGSGYVARRLRDLQPRLARIPAQPQVQDISERISALKETA